MRTPREMRIHKVAHNVWRVGRLHGGIVDAASAYVTVYGEGERWHVVGVLGADVLIDLPWGKDMNRSWRRAIQLALTALREAQKRPDVRHDAHAVWRRRAFRWWSLRVGVVVVLAAVVGWTVPEGVTAFGKLAAAVLILIKVLKEETHG